MITLALGIGANTTIFTLINAVMLQTLPVKDPVQLVLFYDGDHAHVYSGNDFNREALSFPSWEYFRDHNESFESVCAFRESSDGVVMHMVGSPDSGPSEQASGHLVSGSYFAVLGVQAAAGRLLTPQDDAPAGSPAAAMSYNFWRRRFNLDRSLIGKAVDLNGTSYTIVGVAPPEFFGERVEMPPDFWLPLSHQPQVMRRESWLNRKDVCWLNLMGRLKPGVTIERAQTTLNTQLHQFLTAQAGTRISPEQQRRIEQAHIALEPGARGISSVRLRYSEPLHILMAIVGMVLLIACANVATLLLARASVRRQELFVRLAVGAARARLMRQLLTESILLALFGAALGIILASWSVPLFTSMLRMSSVIPVRPNLFVLCFTVAISIVTGLLFGLVPALRASDMEIKTGSIAGLSAFRDRSLFKPARALVVLQVGLSLPLLVAAALLTHSLLDLERQDLGFNRERLLLVSTDPRLAGYQPAELFPLYRRIYDRLNSLPGVASASIAGYSPVSGSSSSGNFSIEGYTRPAGQEMDVHYVAVGPKFFETLGIPLLVGRSIGPQDTATSPLAAVISESIAQEYFPVLRGAQEPMISAFG